MGLTRIRAEQISDIDYKQAVRVITRTNVTLSGGAPATVDGVSLVTGDRILVNGQSNAAQNGLYQVQTVGAGSNGTWVRTLDANADGEIEPGMVVMVTEGLTYADTPWKLITNGEIIIGTTELTFTENYSLAFGNIFANGTAVIANTVSAPLTLTAGDNISIVGNNTSKSVTIGVTGITTSRIANGTSNVDIATANGNVTTAVAGNTILTVASTGANVAGLVTATGNITGGNITTDGLVTATGNVSGGNLTTAGRVAATGNVSGGNLTTAGRVDATGNVSGGNLLLTGNIFDSGTSLQINTTTAANIALAPNGAIVLTATTTGANISGTLGVTGNTLMLGRELRVGADFTNFSAAGRGAVSINGTNDTILEFNEANINRGYLYHTGTDMSLWNAQAGVLNLATSGTIRLAIDSAGTVNIPGTLDVRTAIDLADDDILRFGTSDDWELYHTAGGDNRMDLNTGNLVIRDDGTTGDPTRFTFERLTGNFTATGNANVGNLSTAGQVVATGNITGGNLSTAGQVVATGNITGGNIMANTAVDLADSVDLRFGSSDDVEFYFSGLFNRFVTQLANTVIAWEIFANNGSSLIFSLSQSGNLQATGNIQGANVISNALVSASTVTATGNITGNNVSTTTSFGLPVYADDTARDAAITSPQPGMMVFVTGTGLQVRGATAWNTVSGTAT